MRRSFVSAAAVGLVASLAWLGAAGPVAADEHEGGEGDVDDVRDDETVDDEVADDETAEAILPIVPPFEPTPPVRLLDTRPGGTTVDGEFAGVGKVEADDTLALQVTGRAELPDEVEAVVLNVTVHDPDGAGFVTAHPCGSSPPVASTANFVAGQTVANALVVGVGDEGDVCLYSDQDTHLIVDVSGHHPIGGQFSAITPARLLDTRPGASTVDGGFQGQGRIAADEVVEFDVGGRADVADDATAVALNVTVNEPEDAGYVTVFPCGAEEPPYVSNLNYVADQTVPNAVLVQVGDEGKVCLYSDETTNVIVDVAGYFAGEADFRAIAPARILDTRPGIGTIDGEFTDGAKEPAGSTIELQVTGRAGVPEHATAVALNVTAHVPEADGFLIVFPCGADGVPVASNVNYVTGQTVPNLTVVQVGEDGKVCVHTDQEAHIITDVYAYYGPVFVPLDEEPVEP